jgi:HSP20 family protein
MRASSDSAGSSSSSIPSHPAEPLRAAKGAPARLPTICADVKESEHEVVVYADLPGVDEDDIDLVLRSNVLRICGERPFNYDAEDTEEYVQLERPYGRLVREVRVPGNLDEQSMTAKYHRGVLKIRIAKQDWRKSK